MKLQDIHDMAADALAGEELQFRNNGDWKITDDTVRLFDSVYVWRIKPTIEVNGVMMSKRQAKAAWEASGTKSYEYTDMTHAWYAGGQSQPDFTSGMHYRWQEPEWIYVNGEKITQSGGKVRSHGLWVASGEESEKLTAALYKLIEVK